MVVRDGVGAVSVRTAAAEAGVSTGSLRHVLATKSDLLAAAMRLASDGATERFVGAARSVTTVEHAVDWLSQLLPLDEERRVEMEIQLALVAEAGGHPALRRLRDEGYDGVRDACSAVLVTGRDDGLFRRSLDLELEATRLHVLLDGHAYHLVGGSATTTPDVARALLTEHLATRSRRRS